MAIEPKLPRKRAIKKSKSKESAPAETVEVSADEAAPKTRKKAAAIPVPVFQAAPVEKAAPKTRKKAASTKSDDVEDKAPSTKSAASDDSSEEADSEGRNNRNRRRRRGGRGRRKPSADGVDTQEDSDSTEGSDDSSEDSADGTTHRRRRRRRATGEGVTPGEVIDEDGVVTVVKVREAREKTDRPARDRSER